MWFNIIKLPKTNLNTLGQSLLHRKNIPQGKLWPYSIFQPHSSPTQFSVQGESTWGILHAEWGVSGWRWALLWLILHYDKILCSCTICQQCMIKHRKMASWSLQPPFSTRMEFSSLILKNKGVPNMRFLGWHFVYLSCDIKVWYISHFIRSEKYTRINT